MKIRIQKLNVALVFLALSESQLSTACAQGGTWSTEASMPTARYGPATGVIGGKLYVASGATVNNSPPYPRFTNLEIYDPAANTWATGTPIPIGIYGATTATINGKLYVAGGQAAQNQGGNIATLQVYDPLSDNWADNAPMPFASANTCGSMISGILYVAGGATPDNTAVVNSLRAYDPGADTWSIKTPLPISIEAAGAGVVNGILYVVGGQTSSGASVNTVVAYDPRTDTWTTRSPMPTARCFLTVGVVNGILYAVGGANGNQVMNTVEAYNPAADTWTTMTPMPTARYAPAVGAINGVIYVVGGNNAAGSPARANLAINEAFTPSAPNQIPVTITTQPASQTVNLGANVTFTVVASGTAPLTYQWKRNGSAVSGATSATLTLSQVGTGDAGTYTVDVSNPGGTVSSGGAVLTVIPTNAAAKLRLQMYSGLPGLIIDGVAGTTYRIEYSGKLPAASWIKLIDLALPSTPFTFIDAGAVNAASRFYRVVVP